MTLVQQFETTFLILIAALLSSLIGLNRERKSTPAGLRTHMLVGVGSCLFTILSIYAFGDGDPGRVASQILPGLGFIGAGAILRGRGSVRGLTTAATLWATAAIGMAVGTGTWFLAINATLLLWAVLVLMRRFERSVLKSKTSSGRDVSQDDDEYEEIIPAQHDGTSPKKRQPTLTAL